MASGNFATMFKDVNIPPLPAAVAKLIAEINHPEPDVTRLELIISAEPEVAVKVIRTINSAYFGLKSPVLSIRHAITLLGLKNIRAIILSYAMHKTLPRPEGKLFDHEAYWTDSLLKALLARSLARRELPEQQDEAFTAMLLADVALPVLLCNWRRYYESVVERWAEEPTRLSQIERVDFGWDHAQASAWILQYWDFPEPIVCMTGAHNLELERIAEMGLRGSIAPAVATAALLPSVLKRDAERCRQLVRAATAEFALTAADGRTIIDEVSEDFAAICVQFELGTEPALSVLDLLATVWAEEEVRS